MSYNSPKISVVMPVYKVELSWLKASIDSILIQSFKEFEFIIVYDCPSDPKILDLLTKYDNENPRIHLILNKRNIGISKSLNKGILSAKGKYIVRMDADDISIPHRLETQYTFMESNPDVSLSGGQVVKINKDGQTLGESNNPNSAELLLRVSRYINPTTHPTWIVKRETLLKIGMYRELPNSEDYDLLLRLLGKNYLITNLDEILVLYRVHLLSQSVAKANVQRICLNYARSLHTERINSGVDNFDINYLNNLISTRAQHSKNHLDPIFLIKSKVLKTKLYGGILLFISALSDKFERDYLICQTKALSTKFMFGILS